jgi:hypothetical protein
MWICVSACEHLVIWCDKPTVHEIIDYSGTYDVLNSIVSCSLLPPINKLNFRTHESFLQVSAADEWSMRFICFLLKESSKMSILIYTYDKTITVWVSESVFMNISDVEKYRDSSHNKSDNAYICIMKQKLMLIRC